MSQVSDIRYYFIRKNVFSFDGENIEDIASSTCDHDLTFGLANYRGFALTTGSGENSNCYTRTELYDFTTDAWNDSSDYSLTS